jgi:cytochrome P450 family 109
MSTIAPFEPLSPEFERNPYAEFTRMREACRAYRHVGTIMPVVSFFRDADIRTMANDFTTWSSQRSAEYNEKALGDAAILIGNDPPVHTHYRGIVAPLFLPGAMNPLVPLVEEETELALSETVGAGEINFVEDYAARVTIGVICRICGVPDKDRSLMREMTLDLAKEDGRPVFYKSPNPETEARVGRVMTDMTAYLSEHIERRRREPTGDILSMLTARVDDPRHLVGLSILIIGAGNETTTNLMAHGLQELINRPDQMAMLRARPELTDQAIEEMLRMRGTIRKMDRISMIDTEIDGVEIRRGDSIALWNASASRDPAAIERADQFDITRRPNRHLAFGSGIHMCIGNALARIELRLAFRRLLERTRTIELTRGADSYESWGNGVLEAGKRLSVELVPA